jgi:hypothetical protein
MVQLGGAAPLSKMAATERSHLGSSKNLPDFKATASVKVGIYEQITFMVEGSV